MRRLLSYLVSSLLILLAFWPQSTLLSAYKNNFYWQQQQMRQSQMLQQQQMRQQQMLQQQRMRQQQEQMRRQQEQARRQQEQMRRQMQERQRQAQLQRQRTAERQRQMQQDRQRKTLEQQRSQTQRQQFAKQQKALQQQKSLREQRKTKLRQDRLRRLQNDRLKKRQADKKKQDGRTTLTLAALLKRNAMTAALPKTTIGIPARSQTQKQFQERRQGQLKKLRVTKQFEKQRKTIQARAQKANELQKRLAKAGLQKKKAAETTKAKQKEAEKAFGVCKGKGCGNKSCSFHGDTDVLTKKGLKPIKKIVAGQDLVWSRSDVSGDSDWKQVTDHYANDYEEIVYITIREQGKAANQTIRSNRIHQFFVVEKGAQDGVPSATGDLNASEPPGKWIKAEGLAEGDRLRTHDGRLAEIVSLKVEEDTLHAYNITVEDFHTYFISAESDGVALSVWVHNDCDDEKGAEKLSKAEAKLLRMSQKGPDGTKVAKEGIGKKAKLHIFKKVDESRWVHTGIKNKTLGRANYAQRTYSETFSSSGKFAGKTIDDVAKDLKSGKIAVTDVPVDYIVRNGRTLILNTRSAQALTRAGISRSHWNAVDRSGQRAYEARLTGQLKGNNLTDKGTPTVKSSGRKDK